MRLGVLSDVHGNLEALEAVLAFLGGRDVDRYVCCGDIVGYGPDPLACIERIRGLDGAVVAGNHDYGAVGKAEAAGFNPAAAEALVWTADRLGEGERGYLAGLPLTAEAGRFLAVHASPSAPAEWRYVLTLNDAGEEMGRFAADVCFLGHSHSPAVWMQPAGGSLRTVSESRFEFAAGARYIVNAGSVGQPRDGDPRACCLVLDEASGELSFHRLEYDIAAVQAKMREAGLPEVLASRLGSGF